MNLRRDRSKTFFAGLLVVQALASACHESYPECYPGDYRACTCTGTDFGYQSCAPGGESYEACRCDGRTPGLDGGEAQ